MSTFILDKVVQLPSLAQKVCSVVVDDALTYTRLKEGIRIEGKIYLSGNYQCDDNIKPFADAIDVDVFVPNKRIGVVRCLKISIADFDYRVVEDAISFHIKCNLEGEEQMEEKFSLEEQIKGAFKELQSSNHDFLLNEFRENLSEEDGEMLERALKGEIPEMEIISTIENDEPINAETLENIVESTIETNPEAIHPYLEIETGSTELVLEPPLMHSVEEDSDIVLPFKEKNQDKLFDKENYVVFTRFYRVKKGDTYASIAVNNNIDVNELVRRNNNKPLDEGLLIEIVK